jgi:hypothetical protein
MSTAQPVQPPAHSAAAHFATGTLRVTGILLNHAEVRHSAGNESHALLVAHISTGAGMPHEATQDLGTSPAAHIAAESKARLLRRGTAVTAVCRGALPRTDHGNAVLRLVDVSELIPHRINTED